MLFQKQNTFDQIMNQVLQKRLTYLSPVKLNLINRCVTDLKRKGVEGDFVEFGVALGGSAICIASELEGNRRFLGFDLFGMIPPPSERDGLSPHERYELIKSGKSKGIGADKYYGYIDNLRDVVIDNFGEFNLTVDGTRIFLVGGLFDETLPLQPEMRIAFAHIDCDWYDPVKYCLEYVAPRLALGGLIILDDYNDWPGCKKATDDFCEKNSELEFTRYRPHAILKKTCSTKATRCI